MSDISGSDSRYCVSEAKSTEKDHVVIVGSVNNDFELWIN